MIPVFIRRIILFFEKFLGIKVKDSDFKTLEGDLYTLRVWEDLSLVQPYFRFSTLKIAQLSYHKANNLLYWAEIINNADIKLEDSDSYYKVRYFFVSGWSVLYRVPPSSLPRDELKQKCYTHVICVWEGGRFKEGGLSIGRHVASIPVDLGGYGAQTVALVTSEVAKKCLNVSDLSQVDWAKEVLNQKKIYNKSWR